MVSAYLYLNFVPKRAKRVKENVAFAIEDCTQYHLNFFLNLSDKHDYNSHHLKQDSIHRDKKGVCFKI